MHTHISIPTTLTGQKNHLDTSNPSNQEKTNHKEKQYNPLRLVMKLHQSSKARLFTNDKIKKRSIESDSWFKPFSTS